jgi:hypothetical protein
MTRLLLGLLSIYLFIFACASQQSRSDPCQDFSLDVKRIWNVGIKARLESSIVKFGGELAVNQAKEVITKMDNITRDWVMIRQSVCRDYFFRKVITSDEYKKRVSCLDANLQNQRNFILAIQSGNMKIIDKISTLSLEVMQCKQ